MRQILGEIAGVSWRCGDAAQIEKNISITWQQLHQQVAKAHEKHDEFLTEISKDLPGVLDQEKAIKQIKAREKSKRQFHRIQTTLNWLKSGGLEGVDVLVMGDNGELQGWRSVTNPSELHRTVTDRNRTHLNQAAPTPLGHGPGYQLFHGEDQHYTARKVLNGELDWQHPMEEVNDFINNLSRVYDKAALEEKTKLINASITVGEFCHYFKNKKRALNRPLWDDILAITKLCCMTTTWLS